MKAIALVVQVPKPEDREIVLAKMSELAGALHLELDAEIVWAANVVECE